MRLGQFSRKINKSSTEICEYMELELGVVMNPHPNAKIDDQYLDKIIEHFNPKEVISEEEKPEIENKEAIPENKESENEIPIEQEVIDTEPSLKVVLSADTIKAKAEKLDGLKVIGKIDLPPPPPAEFVEIDGVMYDKEIIKQERKEEKEKKRNDALNRQKERIQKRKENSRPADKVITRSVSFAEIKKKEDKNLENKRESEEKRRKERQHKHYKSKHLVNKTVLPKKKKVKKVTEVLEFTDTVVDTNPPKTWFSKFWRWLNTY